MVSKEEVVGVLEETRKDIIDTAMEQLEEMKPGEVVELFVSGWIVRKDEGYRIGIWRGLGRGTMSEYADMVKENTEFLELYAKSLTPTKVLILLRAYDGASEGELSEFVGLKGGALHYHIRDLIYLGLLKKKERGHYETTRYGEFVIRTAISAIRKFKRSVEQGTE